MTTFSVRPMMRATALLAVVPFAVTSQAQQKLTLHHHDAARQPTGMIVVPA